MELNVTSPADCDSTTSATHTHLCLPPLSPPAGVSVYLSTPSLNPSAHPHLAACNRLAHQRHWMQLAAFSQADSVVITAEIVAPGCLWQTLNACVIGCINQTVSSNVSVCSARHELIAQNKLNGATSGVTGSTLVEMNSLGVSCLSEWEVQVCSRRDVHESRVGVFNNLIPSFLTEFRRAWD